MVFYPDFPTSEACPAAMAIPRKATPSRLTLRGSVAIGGDQVGIYPQDSPGGWNVVGNCPIPLMDFTKTPPNPIEPADRIQFFENFNSGVCRSCHCIGKEHRSSISKTVCS